MQTEQHLEHPIHYNLLDCFMRPNTTNLVMGQNINEYFPSTALWWTLHSVTPELCIMLNYSYHLWSWIVPGSFRLEYIKYYRLKIGHQSKYTSTHASTSIPWWDTLCAVCISSAAGIQGISTPPREVLKKTAFQIKALRPLAITGLWLHRLRQHQARLLIIDVLFWRLCTSDCSCDFAPSIPSVKFDIFGKS